MQNRRAADDLRLETYGANAILGISIAVCKAG